MTTSSSSLIIILVLNIFFSISSFVSSRETRNDDVTLPELHTLVQQQAVTIQQQGVTIQQQAALLQTLQAKLTADESVIQQQGLNIQQQGVTIQQQASLLQTLQAKLTADENAVMQQHGVTIQTLEAKLTADESTIHQQGVTIQQQAALLQTLQAKLTADESTVQQQAALLQTLQAKLTADESTVQQQAALLQTLQAKLTADESTVQQLQAKQSNMEARQNKNVAFTATFGGGSPSVNIGVHGIVKFNNVITNIGGAYNAATGIFTAPVAGTYAFFFNGQSDNAHIPSVYMEVSKNGNSVLCMAVMEGNTQDMHDKGTCFALSHLHAGDQVSARENTGGQSTYLNENHFTSFSGFLVQAD